MKKKYIIPVIEFEDIELDGVMNQHPSQWSIDVNNEAPDNHDEHGSGLEGSDITDPDDLPIWGD